MKRVSVITILFLMTIVIVSVVLISMNKPEYVDYNNHMDMQFPEELVVKSDTLNSVNSLLTYFKWQYPADPSKPNTVLSRSIAGEEHYDLMKSELENSIVLSANDKLTIDLSSLPDSDFIVDREINIFAVIREDFNIYLDTEVTNNIITVDLAKLNENEEYIIEISLEYKYASYGVYNFKLIRE